MFSIIPIIIYVLISELIPALINGSGVPVFGRSTLPSAKLAKGTGRDGTYPTHVNTHENRTPGTQQNYPTKPHNRTCPEHHKNSSVGERRTARGCTNTPDECQKPLLNLCIVFYEYVITLIGSLQHCICQNAFYETVQAFVSLSRFFP